ncbi:hypothetical protein QAD02_023144 [Eretmocerus hayati]|uniref:Uncharacterized protein n=1 Tax=Eretmocerus hayati TaxID=131215 RepID=A0ACC2PV95_9HYME|nr:hypothetical protein QAD02_023144 [Eretmocerus hayati]
MESRLINPRSSNNSTFGNYLEPFDDDSPSNSPQSPILAGHIFFADCPIEETTNISTTRSSDDLIDENTSLGWEIQCSEDTINKNLDVISNNELSSLDVVDSASWVETSQKVAELSMRFKAEKSIGNLSSMSDKTFRLMVPQSTGNVVTCTPKTRNLLAEHDDGDEGSSRMNLYDAERLELEARIKIIELEQCFESLYRQNVSSENSD